MKILYDNKIFDEQKFGGISLYFSSLLKASGNDEYVFPYRYSDNYHLKEALKHRTFLQHKELFSKVGLKGFWRVQKQLYKLQCFSTKQKNDTLFKRKLQRGSYDIYHQTYYRDLTMPKNRAKVVTVYDMINEKFPEYFPNYDSSTKLMACRSADKIIAISHTTKKDLVELFNIAEEKVEVVYLGFDGLDSDLVIQDISLGLKNIFSKKVIFYNGSRGVYKNFDKYIEAISPSIIKYDLHLLCSGMSFTKTECDLFNKLGIDGRLHASFLSDEELKFVYSNCEFLVFPTLYEGFGIPLTEAMFYGCPMLLSDTPCFKEVANDAALYFDPKNSQDMREKFEYAINNPTFMKDLSVKGSSRYKFFGSWKNVYKNTKKVYELL